MSDQTYEALQAAAARVVDLWIDGAITAPDGDGPAALLALARAIPDEARGFRPKRTFSPYAPELTEAERAFLAEIAKDLPVWTPRRPDESEAS